MTEKTYPVQDDRIANGGVGVPACDKNIGNIVILLIFLIAFVWLTGCAPLPSLEEEGGGKAVEEISAQSMAKAERDSIIAVRRSFAYERWKNGDYETARMHFNTIRQYDIDHGQNIYRSWADCFVRSDMIDSALFAYEEGIKYFPEDDYLRSSLSIIYKNSGRFEEAIEQMVEAIKIRTASSLMKSSELKKQVEALELQMEPLKIELDSLKQLLQSGADNAEEIVKAMGDVTRKIAEAAGPITVLIQKVVDDVDDKMIEYLYALSELYETVEDWDKAIETYEKLSELLPYDPLPSQRKIDIIRMYRDPEEYLNSMKEAVERFPDDPRRRFDYGVALLDQGFSEKAVSEFEIYCEQEPDDPEGWRNLAAARDNLNDYRGAINALKKVIELEPESLVDLVAIGENYIYLKNWVEARRWAKKALAKDGGFGAAWLLMGDIYYKAADLASGDSPKYDDKLVFVIAYGLYKRAAGSDDLEAGSDGKRGMNILKGSMLLPSKEERFMHREKSRPSGRAYAWIKHDWHEVGYIDSFLKTLD